MTPPPDHDAGVARTTRQGKDTRDALSPSLQRVDELTAEGEWRCFHCNFVTSDREEAELHFGPASYFDAMCKMTDAGQRREYITLDRAYSEICKARIDAEARIAKLEAGRDELEAEVADLKSSVIAFAAPWAATYGRDHGYPANHLHPAHYDLLERCGGRMVDFTRALIRNENQIASREPSVGGK